MVTARWTVRRLAATDDGRPGRGPGVDCHELDSGAPGPLVVVLGGVHGDEPEGTLAAGQLCRRELPLRAGRLRVVPVANEEAFGAASRVTPADGVNLARVFPGDPAGSPTLRLAALLSTRVLADADLLIDLHTAGRHYDMPLFVGCLADDSAAGVASRAAAEAFGLDTVWLHPTYSPGRSLSVPVARGRPAIYAEGPGGGSVDRETVGSYVRGVLGALTGLRMLAAGPPAPPPTGPVRYVAGGGDLDRDVLTFITGGLFAAAVAAGDAVRTDQLLGTVQDVYGTVRQELRAPHDGRVMFLRRSAHVRPDDVAASLAEQSGTVGAPSR
jgi:predicted deacylase